MTVSRSGDGMRTMSMRPWLEPSSISVPVMLAAAVGGHPLVAQTLARRGVTTPAAAVAFLDPDAYLPTPPDALPGMARAARRVLAVDDVGAMGESDLRFLARQNAGQHQGHLFRAPE